LGFINITERFIPFAVLAGITQAIQAFLMPKPAVPTDGENTFQNQLAKSMSVQTRYVLPIIIIFIASKLSAAVSLYWIVANLFSIGQEIYFRKKFDALYK
jgi:membrane protein insertase Oxa1/YidC/SpoIIIJ